ncbi:MAG TPA: cell division topological specificity factor MinE [Xanthobacteraceae bacterium]|jgi:cell division topological specificity factor|nr:cell division topological specificity factor MinE [Xanthobacteraceae bacterium]
MKIFELLSRRRSAPLARERLQILLTHERGATGQSGLIAVLREEILAVIARHVDVAPEKVDVRVQDGDELAVLEIDVEIPRAMARPRSPWERGGRAA